MPREYPAVIRRPDFIRAAEQFLCRRRLSKAIKLV